MEKEILYLTCFLFLATPALATDLYQAKEIVEVYERPSTSSRVIYRLQTKEEFKVIGKARGGWLKVRFSTQDLGYVKERKATPLFSIAGMTKKSGYRKIPAQSVSSLALGKWAYWKGLAISVKKYEITQECRGLTGRGYQSGPAEGAKLVYIWVAVRNEGSEVIDLPSFFVDLSGVEKDSGWFGGTVCRYDNEALGNACHKGRGKLYPEVMCGGWELFEVIDGMEISEQFVTVSVHRWMKNTRKVGQWHLGESKSR